MSAPVFADTDDISELRLVGAASDDQGVWWHTVDISQFHTSRWKSHHHLVVVNDEATEYWRTSYSKGLTEEQDSDDLYAPWQQVDLVYETVATYHPRPEAK